MIDAYAFAEENKQEAVLQRLDYIRDFLKGIDAKWSKNKLDSRAWMQSP